MASLDRGAGLLAEPALEHEGVDAEGGELVDDGVDVVGALGEHEAGAAVVDRGVDVGTDLRGATVVVDEGGEHRLDVRCVVLAHLGGGGVDDQLSADQLGALDGPGLDLVAGRSAVEADDRFELVAPVRGGGQAEPSSAAGGLDAGGERHGGEVVALVDHDEAVGVEHGRVAAAGEALEHRDVDRSRSACSCRRRSGRCGPRRCRGAR